MPNIKPTPVPNTSADDLTSSASNILEVRFDWFRAENTANHHTRDYENDTLVLRRGGTFKLGVTFHGNKISEIEDTVLRFGIEPKPPGFGDNIYINCGIKHNIHQSKWEMKIVTRNREQMVVEINVPVNAGIGKYRVDVVLPSYSVEPLRQRHSNSTEPVKQSHIIVLFNPWSKDDDVYLYDEEERKEYVLNDAGILFQGFAKWDERGITAKKWDFGQFEEKVLDCVLSVLEKDKRAKKNPLKSLRKRTSPVWVARVLSAVLNNFEDDGILTGNWSGNYDGGVPPTRWNGSVEIYQQYYKTGKPVNYGQCWVFSGIMTTALRALGIPARSVTNFVSAHDTDKTMTIDSFYDENGDRLSHLCNDSIWNFHVWNEMWSKRKDLPNNAYDGWQAVDATPQEQSSGLFQMGPAPLKAVKEGEVYAGFDTGFVFGEVNADIVNWIVERDDRNDFVLQKVHSRKKRYVGRFISTKMAGQNIREDITHLYKYREGSTEERRAFYTAHSFGQGPTYWAGHLETEEEGHYLTIDLGTSGSHRIGDAFTCTIDLKNTSYQKFTVDVTGVVSSMLYSGEVKALVKRRKIEAIEIDSGTNVSQEIRVDVGDYVEKLTDLNYFKFVVVAKILESNKRYVDDMSFQLVNKECIEINIPESPIKVNQLSEIEITFTNPLPLKLSNLTFSVEGIGLLKPIRKIHRELPSGKKETARFYVKPRKPAGLRTLLVDVDSLQVKDFKAAVDVQVVE